MEPCYEIRLAGCDGQSPDDVFDDLKVITDGEVVLMIGRLDQSALHGVLERVRARRWQLLEVRRIRGLPRYGE